MKIVQRKIHDLIAAEYNPRQLTADQFEQIKSSLQRFGFVDPVIVNVNEKRKNIIVGGHQRVKVAREIGMFEVPTVEVDLDAEQERELNVRLNKNTGEWDWDALANNFDIDELCALGFTENELCAFDVSEVAAPEIPTGEKSEFRQMTFTLHSDQAEIVMAAIDRAKELGHGESAINDNSNGNAIAWICNRSINADQHDAE